MKKQKEEKSVSKPDVLDRIPWGNAWFETSSVPPSDADRLICSFQYSCIWYSKYSVEIQVSTIIFFLIPTQ